MFLDAALQVSGSTTEKFFFTISKSAVYYPMDRIDGNTLRGDREGNVSAATIVPGLRGGAIRFQGGQWAELPKHP